MPQLPQCLGFNLADTLASDRKVLAHFLQSVLGSGFLPTRSLQSCCFFCIGLRSAVHSHPLYMSRCSAYCQLETNGVRLESMYEAGLEGFRSQSGSRESNPLLPAWEIGSRLKTNASMHLFGSSLRKHCSLLNFRNWKGNDLDCPILLMECRSY
jgi:hypothetical protein